MPRLMATFMVTASPSGPMGVIDAPMERRKGRTRSSAAASPPTKNASLPCSTVTALPDTGASRKAPPAAATSAPSARVTAGLTVLMSAQTAPRLSPARMPSGPCAICRRASELVTMLSTTSPAAAASRGEPATRRPAETSASALARVRL